MPDDAQHLRLLSIFHYVLAGITALFGCFPVIHLTLGIAILSGRFEPQGLRDHGEKELMGSLFAGVGGAMILAMWSFAVLIFCAGRSIQGRRRHTFCLIVAGLECLMMPFGTVLGVFTILVLVRPSVESLFRSQEA